MKYLSSLLILMLSLSIIPQTQAQIPEPIAQLNPEQQAETLQAINDAIQDIDAYDSLNWFLTSTLVSGCVPVIGGIIVIATANSRKPPPPVERLLGKTPTYVDHYTHKYQEGIKGKRVQSASVGCAIGSVAALAVLLYQVNETHKSTQALGAGTVAIVELFD